MLNRENIFLANVNNIAETPGQFCMSFHFDSMPLIRSIEKFGLMNNPFVTKTKEGRVEPVVGYRRIIALKRLKKEVVHCVDLSNADLSPFDLLLFNLYDNLSMREFNDIEKGMILSRLLRHIPKDEISRDYMPLLKLPSNEETLDLYLDLDQLDHEIRTAIAKKTLSLRAARLLLQLDPESRSSIFLILNNLKFNINNQLQLIDYMFDISNKEGLSISDVIMDEVIQKVILDNKLNNPQKGKKMINHLRQRRYPRLSRFEEGFRQRIESLGLPKDIKISHPPFFESSDYRLEIRFKGSKDLKKILEKLYQKDNLENIFKLFNDYS
ncbi:MAG: ParB/RepB/Spo0J family partition protein [Pseudomonadota bacterium]